MKIIVAFLTIYVLYLLQKTLYNKNWLKNLDVKVDFCDAHVTEGQKTKLVEIIENNKWLPIPFLHIKFTTSKYFLFPKEKNTSVSDLFYRHDIFSIGSYKRISRYYAFTCTKRGAYTINFIDVLSKDLFLIETYSSSAKTSSILYVKPRFLSFNELPTQLVTAVKTVIMRTRTLEDPFEFKGIRDYQPYDNIRYINWKATAKIGNLQVNTHFPTTSRDITICLNLETQIIASEDTMKEACIRLAYTIAQMLSDQGVPFKFYSNGIDQFTKEMVQLQSGCGAQHMNQLGIALARIDTSKRLPDIRPLLLQIASESMTAKQVIFISNCRKSELVKVYEDSLCSQCPCLYILPEFHNVTLEELHITNLVPWEVNYNENL